MTSSNHQKHQAGRHLAVAEALLHGHSASLQGAWTFIKVNGCTVVVMVAGQGAWMIDDIDRFTAGTSEAYVLVDLTGGRRDFYVVPGDELRGGLTERYREFLERVGGTRPRNPDSRHTTIDPAHVQPWLNGWALFDRLDQADGGSVNQ